MKLLVLGGTRFLGRHVVECAVARGHEVTLFHRGRTRPELFPECERVLGDRETGLAALGGRTWDAVVDTCGFVPRIVSASARALAGRVGCYAFVSSLSAYAEPVAPGSAEDAPLARLEDPAVETVSGATYGGLKAACERAVEEALPGRALHVRAGLLVGPWDYTERFGYWVSRLAEGGEALVPDAPDQPLQLLDARDAAAWIVGRCESGGAGAFNVTGPLEPLTLGGFFDAAAEVLGVRPRRVAVAPEFLAARGVQPWSELPLWAPGGDGFLSVSIRKAAATGLATRPLAETVRDTHAWLAAGGASFPGASPVAPPAALTRERERELLEAWRTREAAV